MLLAVDIGNSNIVFGLWRQKKWILTERFETRPIDGSFYRAKFNHPLKKHSIPPDHVTEIIIGSVVPEVNESLLHILNDLFSPRPVFLNSSIDTGLHISNEHTGQIGADLIAGSVAAYHLAQDNCIVVDFGTATTVMAVQKPGILAGGAICAGLKASKEALIGQAAQLYDIELKPPPSVLGKNTIETMQSGLVVGHIAMVEGLIKRFKKELGPCKVVATGGFVKLLTPLTETFDFVEPHLTLNGMRLIVEKNK